MEMTVFDEMHNLTHPAISPVKMVVSGKLAVASSARGPSRHSGSNGKKLAAAPGPSSAARSRESGRPTARWDPPVRGWYRQGVWVELRRRCEAGGRGKHLPHPTKLQYLQSKPRKRNMLMYIESGDFTIATGETMPISASSMYLLQKEVGKQERWKLAYIQAYCIFRTMQFTEEMLGQAEKTELDAYLVNLLGKAESTKRGSKKIMKQTEVPLNQTQVTNLILCRILKRPI
ncbi:uncharacterized protein [Narcine bancroftii]|uniref:uncharacterized protein n=2 Tax=Narcine bancroftii TaxID=1343680 RepID=UPI003831EB0A